MNLFIESYIFSVFCHAILLKIRLLLYESKQTDRQTDKLSFLHIFTFYLVFISFLSVAEGVHGPRS